MATDYELFVSDRISTIEKQQFEYLISEILSLAPSDSHLQASIDKQSSGLSAIIIIDSCRLHSKALCDNKQIKQLVKNLKKSIMTDINEWKTKRFNQDTKNKHKGHDITELFSDDILNERMFGAKEFHLHKSA